MDAKKKPGLLLAIGMGKPKKPPMDDDSGSESADSEDSDFDAAAKAVMDALKEDDSQGFAAALKAAIMSASDLDSDEPEPESHGDSDDMM